MPMGQFPRQMITGAVDTVVVRNVPSVNMRLGINKHLERDRSKISINILLWYVRM